MDPNATLLRIRWLTRAIQETHPDAAQFTGYALELAELVSSLDRWLSTRGFKPSSWDW